MNLYDDAYLYDLVHGDFAEDEIARFFIESTEQYGSPVLELACGTGNILIPLAEAAVDIFGLDISDKMLAACRRKAAERDVKIHVGKGDMRGFDLDRKFRLIYIAGNSLQHLNSIEEISSCFESVRQHLEPDGRFLVEVFNPYIPLLVREMGKRYMVGSFGDHVLTEDVNYDSATQISHINWHFWHRPDDRERTLSFSMRQFFPQELDSLFVLHGFQIEHKFGEFDRSEFTGGSPAQIVIATLK
jgi:SAM-dependent methyltransferase